MSDSYERLAQSSAGVIDALQLAAEKNPNVPVAKLLYGALRRDMTNAEARAALIGVSSFDVDVPYAPPLPDAARDAVQSVGHEALSRVGAAKDRLRLR